MRKELKDKWNRAKCGEIVPISAVERMELDTYFTDKTTVDANIYFNRGVTQKSPTSTKSNDAYLLIVD